MNARAGKPRSIAGPAKRKKSATASAQGKAMDALPRLRPVAADLQGDAERAAAAAVHADTVNGEPA